MARINIERSPSGTTALIAPDIARVYEDGHAGDPAYLVSGILVSGTTVRVAISSTVDTTLARVVGIPTLDAGARARCSSAGRPALPIVARRYDAPPARAAVHRLPRHVATSTTGAVDTVSPCGYDGRTPASEAEPGPGFELYGPGAKATNESSFRGFVALDVRNFQSTTSRVYYNGVTPGITENTLKNKEGEYLLTGYPGPMFPPITTPADPNDQVAALLGNDTTMVVGNFDDVFASATGAARGLQRHGDGDPRLRHHAAVRDRPAVDHDGAGRTGRTSPSRRNDAFNSTVTLHLHGDAAASAVGHPDVGHPARPAVTPPGAGDMNEPTWSTDVFIPAKNGTTVDMQRHPTNAVPAGHLHRLARGPLGQPVLPDAALSGAGQDRRRGARLQPGELDHQRHIAAWVGRHHPDLRLDHQRQRAPSGAQAAAP